jgi:4-aminobutyrate aminotransferase
MANAQARGEQLRSGLRELSSRHPSLSGVRGLGLMTAVDLPSAAHRARVIQEAFNLGLLLLGCGESALRFCPALCVTPGQVESSLRILDSVLGAVEPAKTQLPATPTAGTLPVH